MSRRSTHRVLVHGDGPLAEHAARAFARSGADVRRDPPGGGLDVLVVAAGDTDSGMDVAMERGFAAPVRAIRAALPALEAAHGTIVVATSAAAREPAVGRAGDAAAEHGLRGFLTTLRVELAAQGSGVEAALVVGPLDDPARTAAALVAAADLKHPRPEVVLTGETGVRGWLNGIARAVTGA